MKMFLHSSSCFPFCCIFVFKGSLTYANDAQLWYGASMKENKKETKAKMLSIVIVPGKSLEMQHTKKTAASY